MKRSCKTVPLIAFVTSLLTTPTFAQTTEVSEVTTSATVANVYVQTPKGVDVFSASSTGKLTLIKGSPFADSGQMEGINGKYLISVGTDYLHTYPIESNGTVGKQASETNTQDYGGSECGVTTGAGSVLDHTGKYLYVQLFNSNECADWQAFQVEANGFLSFLGNVDLGSSVAPSSVLTISNYEFLYGITPDAAGYYGEDYYCYTDFTALTKTPDGLIAENNSFSETDPEGNSSAYFYYFRPILAQADPHGHLAVLMSPCSNSGNAGSPNQLASYTINSTTGGIISNNTWADMPSTAVGAEYPNFVTTMNMSPSGLLLAVAGHTGLQIFHFNGAAPLTTFSSLLLPTVNIDQVKWDNSSHLYALSYESQKIYVFTVTPTNINEVSGSPYAVGGAYGITGLIVVPK